MSRPDPITTITSAEYYQLMSFLEESYNHPENFFQSYYPQVWKKQTIQYENRYLIKKRNKIVSHVGLFPLIFVMDGKTEVKMGGIGGVATKPDYRGQGLMAKLLKYTIHKMEEKKNCLSILWGSRHRYGHFGWELSGREFEFVITKGTLERLDYLHLINIWRYKGNKNDLEKIIQLHKKDPLRIKRTKSEYSQIFKKTHIETWLGKKGHNRSYVVLDTDKKSIVEFGGNSQIFLETILSILKKMNLEKITIKSPVYPSELVKTCYRIADDWTVRPFVNIKIINLKETIKSFLPQIKSKWEKLNLTGEYTLILKIKETRKIVQLKLDATKNVEITDKMIPGKILTLSEKEMVRLLFDSCDRANNSDGILNLIFPLDFYIWELDRI